MKQQSVVFLSVLMICACAQTDISRQSNEPNEPQISESENKAENGPVVAQKLDATSELRDRDAGQSAPHKRPASPLVAPPIAMAEMSQQSHHAESNFVRKQAAERRMFSADSMVMPAQVAGHLVGQAASKVPGREGYDYFAENRFQQVALSPLSTFGLDVDTASYSNVRRFLSQGQLPPVDAVRIEELINYFDYDFAAASAAEDGSVQPLSVATELGNAPWNPAHKLVMIGVQARELQEQTRPANRLVFLIDTSGSMNNADKLPLLKRSFQILVEQMRPQDSVAIVTYAGSAGLVLPSTNGNNKEAIYAALNRLSAGGSTAGASGIQLAYQVAQQQFLASANNRVILATDGDFNVGQSSEGELVRMIEARRDQGVFLSILGFGTGNYQEAKMQQLAGHGNGTHHYIDTDREARRVFRSKLQGTLYTVAKDAKIQVEWNPATVAQYRLIGYENRMLNAEDFKDDRKDAGDVGAGHSVMVLYEIVPAQTAGNAAPDQSGLRYQQARPVQPVPAQVASNELGLIKLRYKQPQASDSREFSQIIRSDAASGHNLQWAGAVAEFGMLLRQSQDRGQANYDAVLARSVAAMGDDELRQEFVGLVRQAKVAGQSQLGKL